MFIPIGTLTWNATYHIWQSASLSIPSGYEIVGTNVFSTNGNVICGARLVNGNSVSIQGASIVNGQITAITNDSVKYSGCLILRKK